MPSASLIIGACHAGPLRDQCDKSNAINKQKDRARERRFNRHSRARGEVRGTMRAWEREGGAAAAPSNIHAWPRPCASVCESSAALLTPYGIDAAGLRVPL